MTKQQQKNKASKEYQAIQAPAYKEFRLITN